MIWHCRANQNMSQVKIFYNRLWKCHNLIFYVTGKVENFHGMNCFFPSFAILFLILLYMFAIKKLINILKWPNPEISKHHHIISWSQILQFYISYQFFSTDVIHQDKKRWKQVKHHWFDIVQPIRPHLRWKFVTITCKNVTILFSIWQEKLKIFMEWTVFSFIAILFLILLYMFAIKKINKHSENDQILKFPNFTISEAEVKF